MANRLGTNDPIYDASRLNTINLASNLGASPVDAITDLTGDVTASGPGSVSATLATVNANVGTFGSATQSPQVTVNAKGLITAISNVAITGVSPVASALTRGSIWRGSSANLAEAYALGAANKVLQSDGTDAIWSTFTLTISGNSTINGSLVGSITGGGTLATGGFTLTVPSTGTAALLDRVGGQTFTTAQTISGSSLTLTETSFSSDKNGANPVTFSGYSDTPSLYAYFNFQRARGSIASPTAVQNSDVLGAVNFYGRVGGGYASGTSILVTVNGAPSTWVPTSMAFNLTNASSSTPFTWLQAYAAGNVWFSQAASLSIGGFSASNKFNVIGLSNVTQMYVQGFTTQTTTVASIARADTAGIGVRPVLSLDFSGSGADNNGGSLPMLGRTTTTAASAIARLAWSLPTGTHASYKGRLSGYVSDVGGERQWLQVDTDGTNADAKIGSATTYLDVVDNGDTFWVGSGSGLPHGSCYGNEIAWAQASAAQNTWYIISDADMADGHGGLNLVAHDGSGKLTVTKAGVYTVTAIASVECSALNKHVQLGITVNGTVVDCTPHYDVSTPNAQLELVAIAEVTLAASGYVEVAIRTTDTGDPDLSVDHLAIKLHQIGG